MFTQSSALSARVPSEGVSKHLSGTIFDPTGSLESPRLGHHGPQRAAQDFIQQLDFDSLLISSHWKINICTAGCLLGILWAPKLTALARRNARCAAAPSITIASWKVGRQ